MNPHESDFVLVLRDVHGEVLLEVRAWLLGRTFPGTYDATGGLSR